MKGVPYYNPEDTMFHFNRLVGLENVWVSPINLNTFTYNGTLVNIFYPWLTMYPMHIIYLICRSWVNAYNIYNILLSIVTIFIAFFSWRKITENDMCSFCCAVIYTYATYRFADIFLRSALGESISLTFFPLIVLGLYNILFKEYNKWGILSVGMTLLAYTHLLSLLMTSFFVGMALIIFLLFGKNHKAERLIAFAKATICSIIMSIGSLAPILIIGAQNELNHPEGSGAYLQYHADPIKTIFLNSITNKPTAHGVGLLIVLILIVDLFLVIIEKDKKRKIIGLIIVSGAIALSLLSSSLFPWIIADKIPFLSIIQFPWRVNAYITLFVVTAFSVLSVDLFKSKGVLRYFIVSVICVLAIGLNLYAIFTLHKDEYLRITDERVLNERIGTLDYVPKDYAEYYNQTGDSELKFYNDGEVVWPANYRSINGTTVFFTIDNVKKDTIIDLPEFWYSTVHVKVNGNEVVTEKSEIGTIRFVSDVDGTIEVQIYHRYDVCIYISWAISLIGGFAFIYLVIFRNKAKSDNI